MLYDGTCYLPDFLLNDAAGRVDGDLYVELKGRMTEQDAHKIKTFVHEGGYNKRYNNAMLIVSSIPEGSTEYAINDYGK